MGSSESTEQSRAPYNDDTGPVKTSLKEDIRYKWKSMSPIPTTPNLLVDGEWPTNGYIMEGWPDIDDYEVRGMGAKQPELRLVAVPTDAISIIPTSEYSINLERDFTSWKFCIWNLSSKDLHTLSALLFTVFDFPSTIRIAPQTWSLFMIKVERMMESIVNPYHNFYHAVDVMQTAAVFLKEYGADRYLAKSSTLTLLLSALLHDLEHPGTDNAYQVATVSALAIRYNDQSVLENHHCTMALKILQEEDTNLLVNLSSTAKKQFRYELIASIMATDMQSHFLLASELEAFTTRNSLIFRPLKHSLLADVSKTPPKSLSDTKNNAYVRDIASSSIELTSPLNGKDQITLLKSLLHAADISNAAKPWTVCKKWSDLVLREFFQQGDLEKSIGLPISPNMDRGITHQDEFALGVSDFIVSPYYLILATALPELETAIAMLDSNRAEWMKLLCTRLESTVDRLGSEKVKEKIAMLDIRKRNVAGAAGALRPRPHPQNRSWGGLLSILQRPLLCGCNADSTANTSVS